MRNRLFCLIFAALGGIAWAAPLERDLGQGLVYLRATSLPADLPAKMDAPACVLDLRFATDRDDATAPLEAWLDRHAGGRQLVFVLINDATAPSALQALSLHSERPGMLTLGPALKHYTPDIVVAVNAAEEQRAYEALAKTKDPASLLAPPPAKERYDEAAIVKAMNEGAPAPTEEPAPDIAEIAKQPDAPAPLTDRTLQRAVQIHQAWLVLRGH